MDFVFGDNQSQEETARRARIEKELMDRVDEKVERELSVA